MEETAVERYRREREERMARMGQVEEPDTAPEVAQEQETAVERYRREREERLGSAAQEITPTPVESDEPGIVTEQASLKKQDLYAPERLTKIRNYMTDRYGVEYEDMGDKDIVEGFVDAMRGFNTNTFLTAGEARYVMNADENRKARAGEAYEIYDQLGNVFVNDGLMGAVDGVKDYIVAAVTDPTNYLGLLTGGVAKAGAMGLTAAGKELVKQAAKEAGEAALKKGFSRAAQNRAVSEAEDQVIKQLVGRTMRNPARKKLISEAAERERAVYTFGLQRSGEEAFLTGLKSGAAKKSLIATGALDASAAVLQDVMVQNLMMEAGAQEEYSLMQTGFSSLLGAVGAGFQLAGGATKGMSGFEGVAQASDVAALRREGNRAKDPITGKMVGFRGTDAVDMALDKGEVKRAKRAVLDATDSWKAKVDRAKGKYEDAPTAVDLIKEIMLGSTGDGKSGGLVKIYTDKGIKIPRSMTVSDFTTNLVTYMEPTEIAYINKQIKGLGINLGDTTHMATNLQDLLSLEISKAGQVLNIMSQVRRTIDAGIVHGNNLITSQTDEAVDEASKDVVKKKYGQYAQGLWRRMLVSSPATSAVNLAGFGQYALANTAADILTGGGLLVKGMMQGGTKTQAGRNTLRQASVYKDITAQKLYNFMDPTTTKEVYLKVLEKHDDIRKVLFDSVTGGIDMNAARYGIDASSKGFAVLESIAEGSAMVSGVRAQDSFTKSQMFIGELDKYLRLKKDVDLATVLREGNLGLLDETVMGPALDSTQKSVFSKDYTRNQSDFVQNSAKIVETISRTPLLGTIVPFGRFMNNVVASTYQWTAGGVIQYASAVAKQSPNKIEASEALARSTVGLSFLGLAIQYDEERQKDELGVYDIRVGNQVINAQNTFPMSLFLASGRFFNDMFKGRGANPEAWTRLMEQVAVGQLASDVEFSNSIRALGETINSVYNSEAGASDKVIETLSKKGGNIIAGFTRPLDFANKMVGVVANNDVAKDVRQSRGLAVLSVSSSKYVDNILEAVLGEMDSVTGEQMRTAVREGAIRDPNPMFSAIGIKMREGRTSGEVLMDKLDLPAYAANKRTDIAAYDKAFNEHVAPLLNERAEMYLKSKDFLDLNKNEQRSVWKRAFSSMSNDVQTYLEEAPTESHIEAMRRKASAIPKITRQAAIAHMRENGIDTTIRDMNYDELLWMFTFADYHKAKLKEM